MRIKFNLNHNVYVQLNDKGVKILNDYYQSEYDRVFAHDGKLRGGALEAAAKKRQPDGYYRFQAWDFMHIFGPATQMGELDMSWLDIYIDASALSVIEEKPLDKYLEENSK